MAFTFPEYTQPTPLDAQRSWTATFESYDQRNDDVYYVVTLHEAGCEDVRFIVQVFPYWAGDDWSGPEFAERMRQELHKLAAAGQTNTAYTGAVTRPRS
jgi:hypothetical protein